MLSKFSSRPVVMETVKSLLDMCCPVLLDDVVVKELVGRVTKEICVATLSHSEELEDEEQERCKKALTLVKVSSIYLFCISIYLSDRLYLVKSLLGLNRKMY